MTHYIKLPPNYGTGGAALGLPRPGALLVLQGAPSVLYTPGAKRALLVEPAPSRGEIGDGSICVQTGWCGRARAAKPSDNLAL
jgi:hypothetical protein